MFTILIYSTLIHIVSSQSNESYDINNDLSPLNLCSSYTQCKRDRLLLEDHCDHIESIEGKPKRRIEFVPVKNERVVEDTSICGVDLHPEYAKLRRLLVRYGKEVNRCIAHSLLQFNQDTQHIIRSELRQYCFISLMTNTSDLSSIISSSECWKEGRRFQRRCADLRRCCEPSMFCEQKASVSRNGRAIELLRQEIGYRLADCRSMRGGQRNNMFHKLDEIRGNRTDEERKNELRKSIKKNSEMVVIDNVKYNESKVSIKIKPRLPTDIKALCSPYVSCANDLFDFRLKCSAAQGIPKTGTNYDFTLAYMEVSPLDDADASCRKRNLNLVEKAIEDQRKVGEYMRECVMNVDVEQSIRREVLPCNADVFHGEIPPMIISHSLLNTTCRIEESMRKIRCNELRSCCLQAQICETSNIYGSLADDFITSSMDLRATMNSCYKDEYKKRGLDLIH